MNFSVVNSLIMNFSIVNPNEVQFVQSYDNTERMTISEHTSDLLKK